MKTDGITDSYSNTPVGVKGYYLKEWGRKAAEMAEKEVIQNVLQETHWNRKEQPRSLISVIKRCFMKLENAF
jgi:hypothetical protein